MSTGKGIVIGLYGVPGIGKTYLLNQLKNIFGTEDFAFYDGSKMIASLLPGGLDAFKKLEEEEKTILRQSAIDTIGRISTESGKTAIVAGHYMFWSEGDALPNVVCTQNDLNVFTHILYLDDLPDNISRRRRDDTERARPLGSLSHISKWKEAEMTGLRLRCRENGILFSVVFREDSGPAYLNRVLPLIRDFSLHTESFNQSLADRKLDEVVALAGNKLETVLVFDADRTLAAEDTGVLFWRRFDKPQSLGNYHPPLKSLFGSPPSYTYQAFRQATMMYEESGNDAEFDAVCEAVAAVVSVHPEFVSLLKLVAEQDHVGAVVVPVEFAVIGGGRISDGLVITAEVKAALVTRLRETHKLYVWAFGDSVLDLAMLGKADQAIVVVGEERIRSKTMDKALGNAIQQGLKARQALLPNYATPRLDTVNLPVVILTDSEFIKSILGHPLGPLGDSRKQNSSRIVHATDKSAAKVLMTPMRDASLAGPALGRAHRRVGHYLAIEFVADAVGTEKYAIRHVQGGPTDGYRLRSEDQTTIVALLRSGEPMALGVQDAFPRAIFVHAWEPKDVPGHYIHKTVLLVDSVVNNGKTITQFVQHIHNLVPDVRIVVVTGVIQAGFISGGGLDGAVAIHDKLSFVTLRLSENKYTGTKATDTGNRLFNTTHLD